MMMTFVFVNDLTHITSYVNQMMMIKVRCVKMQTWWWWFKCGVWKYKPDEVDDDDQEMDQTNKCGLESQPKPKNT